MPRSVNRLSYMTVMTILHRKGVLDREKLGRAWRYWPVEAREDHDARLMAEVLRSGGDQDVTMRRFLERVSDDEMRSLCGALAASRSRRLAVPEACRPVGSARGRGTGRIRTPTRT